MNEPLEWWTWVCEDGDFVGRIYERLIDAEKQWVNGRAPRGWHLIKVREIRRPQSSKPKSKRRG